MADPPSENDAPPTPPRAVSVVSEDTSVSHPHPPPPPQWQWHAPRPPLPSEPVPSHHPAVAMAQYYEARMREHAAEYASAAAGAAWAAAQIASSPSPFAALPPALPPVPQPLLYGNGGYEQPQLPQPPPHHQHLWHPPPQASEEHVRPGKRQQTMSTNDAISAAVAPWSQTAPRYSASPAPPFSSRRQDDCYNDNNNNSEDNNSSRASQKRGRRRMRPDTTTSSDNSTTSRGRGKFQRKQGRRQQQQQHASLSSFSDQTLLGKTGVSALHEWCAKRKLSPPQFVLVQPPSLSSERQRQQQEVCGSSNNNGFTMSAQVQGKEYGRGRGGTKGSAKQEAARQALQALLPGVIFDGSNGILVELPKTTTTTRRMSYSSSPFIEDDDLAPVLASRLAIGEKATLSSSKKKRQAAATSSSSRRRSWDVYPGTSTTTTTASEDDDYLASRGASVCSALLHALWQIDDAIPEPPSYTYEVDVGAAMRKGDDAARSSATTTTTVAAIRGSSFTCTAKLKVRRPLSNGDNEETEKESTGCDPKDKETSDYDVDRDEAEMTCRHGKDEFSIETLVAVGTAGSKREARHAASAKLLSMLFPECNGMAEVKAAAEATRERFAASKAQKMRSRRFYSLHEKRKFNGDGAASTRPRKRSIDLPTSPDATHPPLPESLRRQLKMILGQDMMQNADANEAEENDVVSVESLSLSEKEMASNRPVVRESISRSISRRKQLDDRVDSALQAMNEVDEEGRFLPEEVNSNDVGRTVLRRAEAEDADWIRKLIANQDDSSLAGSVQVNAQGGTLGPLAMLGVPLPPIYGENASLSVSTRLWGSTAIPLLLCRVISPKDDPPLGCAVLTLGFSMAEGPTLRIAELFSEPHLPKERFIECLDKFASHMKCTLQTESVSNSDASPKLNSSELMYTTEELRTVIRSHIGEPQSASKKVPESDRGKGESTATPRNEILDLKTIGTSLQSVQEEEVEAEEHNKGKQDKETDSRHASKGDKPSKRSRVV